MTRSDGISNPRLACLSPYIPPQESKRTDPGSRGLTRSGPIDCASRGVLFRHNGVATRAAGTPGPVTKSVVRQKRCLVFWYSTRFLFMGGSGERTVELRWCYVILRLQEPRLCPSWNFYLGPGFRCAYVRSREWFDVRVSGVDRFSRNVSCVLP